MTNYRSPWALCCISLSAVELFFPAVLLLLVLLLLLPLILILILILILVLVLLLLLSAILILVHVKNLLANDVGLFSAGVV